MGNRKSKTKTPLTFVRVTELAEKLKIDLSRSRVNKSEDDWVRLHEPKLYPSDLVFHPDFGAAVEANRLTVTREYWYITDGRAVTVSSAWRSEHDDAKIVGVARVTVVP